MFSFWSKVCLCDMPCQRTLLRARTSAVALDWGEAMRGASILYYYCYCYCCCWYLHWCCTALCCNATMPCHHTTLCTHKRNAGAVMIVVTACRAAVQQSCVLSSSKLKRHPCSKSFRSFRWNHLSNSTCLTQVFFKGDE